MKKLFVLAVVICALFGSCKDTPTTPKTKPVIITLSSDVTPIILTRPEWGTTWKGSIAITITETNGGSGVINTLKIEIVFQDQPLDYLGSIASSRIEAFQTLKFSQPVVLPSKHYSHFKITAAGVSDNKDNILVSILVPIQYIN